MSNHVPPMNVRGFSIREALINPKGVFGAPDNVVSDPRLDRRTKMEILHRWRDDACSQAAAEPDSGEGGAPRMLHRIESAIDRLGSNDDC